MKNKKVVYLDMDGTIADLYNVPNWLEGLTKEKKNIFLKAKPLIKEKELLKYLPKEKYEIRILSMTPKNASPKYRNQVVKEKNKWLDKYFPSIEKRIYLKYGDNKNLKNSYDKILIDDNKKIRKNFNGLALSPMWL